MSFPDSLSDRTHPRKGRPMSFTDLARLFRKSASIKHSPLRMLIAHSAPGSKCSPSKTAPIRRRSPLPLSTTSTFYQPDGLDRGRNRDGHGEHRLAVQLHGRITGFGDDQSYRRCFSFRLGSRLSGFFKSSHRVPLSSWRGWLMQKVTRPQSKRNSRAVAADPEGVIQ